MFTTGIREWVNLCSLCLNLFHTVSYFPIDDWCLAFRPCEWLALQKLKDVIIKFNICFFVHVLNKCKLLNPRDICIYHVLEHRIECAFYTCIILV
jgi:hypothetical protein